MKKHSLLFTLIAFLLWNADSLAQKEISGKSKTRNFKMDAVYKRGLPPNLFVDLQFSDDNGNGILEASETGASKSSRIQR